MNRAGRTISRTAYAEHACRCKGVQWGREIRDLLSCTAAQILGVERTEIASESKPRASARATVPTSRKSDRLFTTGTLRTSLESRIGSTSVSFWFGVRQAG